MQRRVFRQAASSNAFRSKTIRFGKLKDSGTPGPGSYKQPATFRKKYGGQQRPLEDNNPSAPPVTWVRVTSAPSIPTRGQSYGYEEGKFGELVMQKAPKGGHSGRPGDVVGPGAYQNLGSKTSTRIATDWARSGSQRTDFTKNGTKGQIPGPGAYNVGAKNENEFFSGEFEPRGRQASYLGVFEIRPEKRHELLGLVITNRLINSTVHLFRKVYSFLVVHLEDFEIDRT